MTGGPISLAITVVLAVACLLGAGCLPYAYPKLSYVPGGDLARAPDCRAFRVDMTANQIDMGENGTYTLTEIVPRPDGSVPPQARVSVERGFYVFGISLNYNVGQSHTTRVRLYRPGYELVELKSWDSSTKVQWVPAAEWRDQERAIDDLLGCPVVTEIGKLKQTLFRKWSGEPFRQFPEVSHSKGMGPLMFAADEYVRVTALAPTPAEADRLREKAKRVIELNPILPKPTPESP
jgi:hypothetical protein